MAKRTFAVADLDWGAEGYPEKRPKFVIQQPRFLVTYLFIVWLSCQN